MSVLTGFPCRPLLALVPADLSRWPVWLSRLALDQDLAWFAALLVWGLALVLWWRGYRRDGAWTWLPASAGTGMSGVLAQFWIFKPPFGWFYERLVPGTSSTYEPARLDPNLFGDIWIATALAAGAAAWGWMALSATPGHANPTTVLWRRIGRWSFAGLAVGVAALQARYPLVGAWLLALLPLPAAALSWPHTRRNAWARAALVAAALLPALSTVGPLAVALDSLQREAPPTPFGVLSAGFHLLAAGLALTAVARIAMAGTTPDDRAALRREARPFVLVVAVWLAGGLLYAMLTGIDSCEEVRINRLRLVASERHSLDPAVIGPIVDSRFRLDRVETSGDGGLAWSEHLASGVAQPAGVAMSRLVKATPFLEIARFVTLRDGWLVAVVSNQDSPPGRVQLLRRATARDRADWDARRHVIEQGPVPEMGQPYSCRAAFTDVEGHMLGWLEYVRQEFHSTTARNWRAAPLLVTALGVIIGAILFAQRYDARAREAAVRQAVAADEANRLKTGFLAKVSHELRTPLQGILGYCDLLDRELPGADSRTRLAALRRSGELMLRLVNDLLDLGAMEAGEFRFVERPVAFAELVHQTVESLHPRATAKGLRLTFRDDPRIPRWVATDGERVRQIVVNLLGNAIKFTDRGGIEVQLGLVERRDDDCLVEIAVADTGPGIAAGDLARLFQPFSRLELARPNEGAGLGLALVEALCRSAGGGVTVESDGRSGSCFRARLRVDSCPPPAPARTATAAEPALTGRRVLVADDNALVRELFASYLSQLGAICEHATDGHEAMARASSGRFDALVLDIAMPGLDGLEVARRLKSSGPPRLRIVGVSAHAGPADRDRALAAGMKTFLSKPVTLPDLAAALVEAPPSPVASPAASAEPELRRRLVELFAAEITPQKQALAVALDRGDWPAMASRAHWLKNSAAVLGDDTLFAAATALESAAEARDAAAALPAWSACRDALAQRA